jgi:hypothetical protein
VQYRDAVAHDGITQTEWNQAGNYESGSSIFGQGYRWFDVDDGRVFTAHGASDSATEYMDGAARIHDQDEEARKKITNTFNTPVVALELRIIPVTYYRWPTMRAAAVAEASLSGRSFKVFNNEATKAFKIRPDLTTEGTESITFTLNDLRSQSPDNSFTVSVADGSINPEQMSLNCLAVGMTNIIGGRSGDSVSLYTNIDYTANPTTLDSRLTGKDVVMVDGVNWSRHYIFHSGYVEQTNTYGLVYPNATTMDKLKDFVINGGTLISMTEHSSYDAYLHPHPSGYNELTQMSFPSQIVHDLGGISGANGGWKLKSSAAIQTKVYERPDALAISAIGTTTGITSAAAENVIDSRSNGITLLSSRGFVTNSDGSQTNTYSQFGPVHMWDGALGHLNSGVKGKIIFMGDSQLKGYNTSQYNKYRNDLIIPLFNYISRNRVY